MALAVTAYFVWRFSSFRKAARDLHRLPRRYCFLPLTQDTGSKLPGAGTRSRAIPSGGHMLSWRKKSGERLAVYSSDWLGAARDAKQERGVDRATKFQRFVAAVYGS